jgi:hypothetical protein
MPFTAAKIVLFFEDQAYMALMRHTATALAAEGIAIPNHLSKFDKEGMDSIYCKLPKPAKVLCVGAAGICGEVQEIQAYKLLAKSQICLTLGPLLSSSMTTLVVLWIQNDVDGDQVFQQAA